LVIDHGAAEYKFHSLLMSLREQAVKCHDLRTHFEQLQARLEVNLNQIKSQRDILN
jgi:hypothetical protein